MRLLRDPAIGILTAFMLPAVILVFSASAPYVPAPGSYMRTTVAVSILLFFALLSAMSLYKGTERKPAGFQSLAGQWREGNRSMAIKFVIAAPVFCALMAAYFASVLVHRLTQLPGLGSNKRACP